MKKTIVALPLIALLTACGAVDRFGASITGSAVSCIEGVEYLQFTSGVTVKYKQDGTVSTCKLEAKKEGIRLY